MKKVNPHFFSCIIYDEIFFKVDSAFSRKCGIDFSTFLEGKTVRASFDCTAYTSKYLQEEDKIQIKQNDEFVVKKDSVYIFNNNSHKSSFKIDNVNYTAESGMTFSEWMNSGYNIDDIEIVDLQDCSNFVSEYVGKRRLINLPSNLTGNAGLVNNLVIQANASYQTELIDGNTCDDGE